MPRIGCIAKKGNNAKKGFIAMHVPTGVRHSSTTTPGCLAACLFLLESFLQVTGGLWSYPVRSIGIMACLCWSTKVLHVGSRCHLHKQANEHEKAGNEHKKKTYFEKVLIFGPRHHLWSWSMLCHFCAFQLVIQNRALTFHPLL